MKTWNELTELEQLQSNYSDFYKDVHGFRPRHLTNEQWNSAEYLRSATQRLAIEARIEQKRIEDAEAHAMCVVEDQLQTIMQTGAKDRKTAVRWLLDSMDCRNDPEHAAYTLGVPYDYFKKDL